MAIHFIKSTDISIGELALVEQLKTDLQADQQVLWLLSGGSNVAVSVAVLNELGDTNLDKLTTSLVDERYGLLGHKDSNAQQLIENGFNIDTTHFIPIISDKSFEQTTLQFATAIAPELSQNDVKIAQIGIGDDGHIAGILPNSEAVESDDLVVGYKTDQYTRITLSFNALKRLDYVYVFSFGEDKMSELAKLRDQNLSVKEQPAQFLKQLNNVYIYNDQIGD